MTEESSGSDAPDEAASYSMSNTKAELVEAGVLADLGSTEEVEAMTKAEIVDALGAQ